MTAVLWTEMGAPVVEPRAVGASAAAPATSTVDLVTFEELYRRESAGLVRIAYLMTSSSAQAEEIVQDAFAKVYERWDRIDVPAAYLRTCAVNGCRRALRRRSMERDRVRAEPAGAPAEHEYLADALACLSPRQRGAVVLRYFADLPESEIAAALGVRPGTVKSLLHRALGELREALQ